MVECHLSILFVSSAGFGDIGVFSACFRIPRLLSSSSSRSSRSKSRRRSSRNSRRSSRSSSTSSIAAAVVVMVATAGIADSK